MKISNLLGQVVHAWVDEFIWKLVGSFFLSRSVDVEHAEEGEELRHTRIVEKGLKVVRDSQGATTLRITINTYYRTGFS